MLRQYYAQRCRGGDNPLRVGVIAVGSIYYLQDQAFFHDRYGGRAVCRTPWIVEAFLNGTMAAARRNRDTGRWEDAYTIGRSDMALVRSLRDRSRVQQVAVAFWSFTTIFACGRNRRNTRSCRMHTGFSDIVLLSWEPGKRPRCKCMTAISGVARLLLN
jgi:hypothetical protein